MRRTINWDTLKEMGLTEVVYWLLSVEALAPSLFDRQDHLQGAHPQVLIHFYIGEESFDLEQNQSDTVLPT